MDSILLRIQECVGDRDTIPKEEVFPQFLKLGYLQQKLVGQHRHLVVKHRHMQTLVALFDNSRGSIPQVQYCNCSTTITPNLKITIRSNLASGIDHQSEN